MRQLSSFSFKLLSWLLLILCFVGCDYTPSKSYRIEFDPAWPSLNLNFKSAQVTGFTLDLLEEIMKKDKLNFVQANGFEYQLIKDLKEKRCDAAIMFITPHSYDLKELDFSPIYLETGPVLVTRKGEKNTKSMKDKEIGAFSEDDMILLAKKYPQAIYRPKTVIAKALGEVASNLLDGVILPRLIAESYCNDLYQGLLEIDSEVLRSDGLRIVTRKEDGYKLQRLFTRQVNSWNNSSAARKAAQKWGLAH